MRIIKSNRVPAAVPLSSLKVGDTFLFDSRIGMVASRNGHDFPLDLATGKEFYGHPPAREWIPNDRPAMLPPSAEVVKINAELIYQILD